jgi:translocation protein SEC72
METPPVVTMPDQVTILPLQWQNTTPNEPIITFQPGSTIPTGYSGDDLKDLNQLSRLLVAIPAMLMPPPQQPVPNPLSQEISKFKEQGNVAFKNGQWSLAVGFYTRSAEYGYSRPIIESSLYARDEIAIALCNRSAAYGHMGEWINALCDADVVIELKKNWPKGYFRRGRALIALSRLNEARESFLLGLQYDPNSAVRVFSTSVFISRTDRPELIAGFNASSS